MRNDTSLIRRGAWLLLCAAVGLGGCSEETGILVEVTRDKDTTTADIVELRFFIGSSIGGTVFVQDANALETVDLPAGRDLLTDPYRLLLRDGIGDSAEGDGPPSVMLAVAGYSSDQAIAFGHFDSPKQFQSGKVLQWQVVLEGRADIPVTDTGCVVLETGKIAPTDDRDCDGDLAPADCNDKDPSIGPSKQEICNNDIDDNCNMVTDEEIDADSDGFTNCNECDDTDRLVNPDAEEVCDGVDNDCDGTCDKQFDLDGDEYSTCGTKVTDGGASCSEPSAEKVDCNDQNVEVHPEAEEICDGVDNDCNEVCDDEWDPDGDLFTECGSMVDKCLGTNSENVDCKPEDGEVYPRAPELCNGMDDNCDGLPYPDTVPCYGLDTTTLGEDVCVIGVRSCDDSEGGAGWGDCLTEGRVNDDAFHAPLELCSAYQTCFDSGVPDPFECAGSMAAAAAVPCTLYVLDPTEAALCPNTHAAIPVVDAIGCAWTLIGGRVQRHYEVGLQPLVSADVPPSGSGDDFVTTCSVWFQVIKANDIPPTHAGVLLWHRTESNPAGMLLDVQLNPTPVGLCPEMGLECATFPVTTP